MRGFVILFHGARPTPLRRWNLALDQRFANGTQGRLLCWYPEKAETRKALQSSHPELFVRFVKESSLKKEELLADIDHMDIQVRQETLTNVQGQPVLVQLPIIPCYALTVLVDG